nr:hypothetical protein [Tanacetum cinerariifolium]
MIDDDDGLGRQDFEGDGDEIKLWNEVQAMKVFSMWMAFEGNTRDLVTFGEETDKITKQNQDSSIFKVLEPGDSVTIYTRRYHTSSSDGVTTSLDGVSPHRLNLDLEDSTL